MKIGDMQSSSSVEVFLMKSKMENRKIDDDLLNESKCGTKEKEGHSLAVY